MKASALLKLKPEHVESLSKGRQALRQNLIDVDNRVDREIARQLAANDDARQADRAARKLRARAVREARRARGEVLLNEWAAWYVVGRTAMGFPGRNMLAQSDPTPSRKRDDEEAVRMTLTEIHAERHGHLTQIDRIIDDPALPMAYRSALFAVYVHKARQADAAIDAGMSEPEFSICLQLAREHVAQQYDDRRVNWGSERSSG